MAEFVAAKRKRPATLHHEFCHDEWLKLKLDARCKHKGYKENGAALPCAPTGFSAGISRMNMFWDVPVRSTVAATTRR